MADFVRLPDGTLLLTGEKRPTPSRWEGLKARVRAALPERFSPRPPPWWIPQPVPVAVAAPAAAPVVAASPVQQALSQSAPDQFAEIAMVAANRERIKRELGTAPQQILNRFGGGNR